MVVIRTRIIFDALKRKCSQATAQSSSTHARGIQVSKSSNGLNVVSYEPSHSIHNAKIGLIFNAGSRHENYDSQGINHMLRRTVGLSAGGLTHIMVSRHMQQLGAGFRAIGTRESLAYVADVAPDALDTCAELFMNVGVLHNHYYNWELLRYVTPKLQQDIEHLYQNDVFTECNERLHASAFAHGLNNSLYMRADKVGSFNIDVINNFINSTFTSQSAVVFGSGVEHNHLREIADTLPIKHAGSHSCAPTVFAGGETRRQLSMPYSHVQLAWEVPKGWSDSKSGLTASLVAYCLDPGASESMTHPEGEFGLIERAGVREMAASASSSGLLHLYSDSGLLGVTIDADRDASGVLVTAVHRYASEMAKNGVSQEDFDLAKSTLKNKLLRKAQDPESLLDLCITLNSSESGFKSPHDLVKELDTIAIGDVNKMAKQIFDGKMAMSSTGDLQKVPYLVDLK